MNQPTTVNSTRENNLNGKKKRESGITRANGKLYDKFCHECKYLEYILPSLSSIALMSEANICAVQSSEPTYALSADYFHISPNTLIHSAQHVTDDIRNQKLVYNANNLATWQ